LYISNWILKKKERVARRGSYTEMLGSWSLTHLIKPHLISLTWGILLQQGQVRVIVIFFLQLKAVNDDPLQYCPAMSCYYFSHFQRWGCSGRSPRGSTLSPLPLSDGLLVMDEPRSIQKQRKLSFSISNKIIVSSSQHCVRFLLLRACFSDQVLLLLCHAKESWGLKPCRGSICTNLHLELYSDVVVSTVVSH